MNVMPVDQTDQGAAVKVHILVVDDEPSTVALLQRFLNQEGYQVVTAADGQEALAQIQTVRPDAVLLDITMPRLDGLSVCRHLRQDYLTRSLPVILLTARGMLSDKLSGLQLGVDDYITKPFDLQEVKARLEGALQRRRWDLWTHPLTHLPGSPAIEEEVRKRLREAPAFAFAYFDIDAFKAYNDVYNYEAGDRVIKDVAMLLMKAAASHPGVAFPGHVGGDDFVLMSSVEHLHEALPPLAEQFDQQRQAYYRPEDFSRHGIITRDRLGQGHYFPLMTLTIAVVSTAQRRIAHYGKLVEVASELKLYLKGREHHGRSLIMWDRRTDAA